MPSGEVMAISTAITTFVLTKALIGVVVPGLVLVAWLVAIGR